MIETAGAGAALSAVEVDAVLRLVAASDRVDGFAPLSEQTLLRLPDTPSGVRHLLARPAEDGRDLLGYAQLDSTGTAELVVAPVARRRGVGARLLAELERLAADATPAVPLQVWSHGGHPGASSLAGRTGYARARVLLQLRRSLRDPLPDPRFPAGISVRTFVPGADEPEWLRVNNSAFATHPEQGRWTLHDVEVRERQSWFDPGGLFLAERDGEIIGFHWTKVHADDEPPIGEVYVVGVRPEDGGQGVGPALTLVGLHHLRSMKVEEVMLYVDEDNAPAVKTYERLGFTRWSADVLYARPRR